MIGQGTQFEAHNLIWSKLVQPKHRFILWLATHRKLLTKNMMIGMRIGCDTVEHLFVDSEWAKAVWTNITQWLGMQIPQEESWNTLRCINGSFQTIMTP
ncbi:hypothetical protein RND71_020030 [Anisodus tanguticus]|uniref:Reverse transcriptase zinc-binding domain-containing protein n=1 Tax=Anisodus tanguticus TaxID=243964 RepID=A0AAE1S048_9SOLA|nr:hypothetical protein RND71_020030 [Anisodus tanguticus]